MISRFQDGGHAIYGVDKLAELYHKFTRETVFNTSRKDCLKQSMGGSFFGGIRKKLVLDKRSFRAIISLVCDTDLKIEGNLPIGKLLHFKANNQEHYKTRAPRYFNLVKRHLFDMDKKDKTHDYVWCFFPMYHTEYGHLMIEELGAFVMWFKLKAKAKIVGGDGYFQKVTLQDLSQPKISPSKILLD